MFMKKISILSMLLMLLFSCTAFAADATSLLQKAPTKIGVVVVGGADVKTPDFFKYISQAFEGENTLYTIETGTAIQSKYQQYWFDKGFLEEQKLTKQDLHDFVKYSGQQKVLFLTISSPIVEKTKISNGWYGMIEQTRASIEVKAFLADDTNILKAVDLSKEDDSQVSELRAKRGAFEKIIKEISVELKDYLK